MVLRPFSSFSAEQIPLDLDVSVFMTAKPGKHTPDVVSQGFFIAKFYFSSFIIIGSYYYFENFVIFFCNNSYWLVKVRIWLHSHTQIPFLACLLQSSIFNFIWEFWIAVLKIYDFAFKSVQFHFSFHSSVLLYR